MYLTLKFTVKVVQDRMIVVSVVTRVEFDENKSSQNDKQKRAHSGRLAGVQPAGQEFDSPFSQKKATHCAISVKCVVHCRLQRERAAAGAHPRR